ncbi:hypothetical protein AB4Y43_07110 [Paraburkholderia sp. BR10872]|uniref:hypothetical protein n=1 Tax=Paraburkholderia sp. BR10872 TaxID=3236989 RepID=UPI0034D37FB9
MNTQQLRTIHAQACAAVARVNRMISPVDDRFWPIYLRAALAAAAPSEICFGADGQLSTETVDKPVQRMSDAERDVRAERVRQVSEEGFTPANDDQHALGELASAAACYALSHRWVRRDIPPPEWPGNWDRSWWKPTTPRRDLVKAGALIIAEIERLDRAGGDCALVGDQ